MSAKPETTASRVSFESVSKTYKGAQGDVKVVNDVSFSLGEGDFVSLIGPSGCGKTTLLRVIADLEQITSGVVRVNGMSTQQARLARAYGYVFQAPALFPWRTVLANVCLPLEIHGHAKAKARAIALEQLARVGLTGFEGKYHGSSRAGCSSASRSRARSASSPSC